MHEDMWQCALNNSIVLFCITSAREGIVQAHWFDTKLHSSISTDFSDLVVYTPAFVVQAVLLEMQISWLYTPVFLNRVRRSTCNLCVSCFHGFVTSVETNICGSVLVAV